MKANIIHQSIHLHQLNPVLYTYALPGHQCFCSEHTLALFSQCWTPLLGHALAVGVAAAHIAVLANTNRVSLGLLWAPLVEGANDVQFLVPSIIATHLDADAATLHQLLFILAAGHAGH